MWGNYGVRSAVGVVALCVFSLSSISCNDKGGGKDPGPDKKGDGCDIIAELCHQNAHCVEADDEKDDATCQCNTGYLGDGRTCERDETPPSGDLLPVGSACDESAECAGPGQSECIIEELAPLAELLSSENEGVATIADMARIFFPNNYCSTVAPCTSNDECGEGGTCFLPLVDVNAETYEDLIRSLAEEEEEVEYLLSFRNYGVCLEACDTDDDCDRAGYKCEVPLGAFVSILADEGARLESYCIGDTSCDACDANATCEEPEEEGLRAECTCNEGYEGDGYTCTPMTVVCDPECDDNATCLITDEGTGCDCDEGYEGDGVDCSAITCDPACGENALCIDDVCECEENFEGDPLDGCTAMEDPCDPNPCANDATCEADAESASGFACDCPAGWEGDLCEDEVVIDEVCDPNPCEHGSCQEDENAADGFSCTCDAGYEGNRCEIETPVDACENDPCENGTCSDDGNGTAVCACEQGWEGDLCDDAVDACEEDPCVHGTCGADGPGSYACECDTGWMGTDCDQEVNGCDENPCENGGTCNDEGAGEVSCTCPSGFEGDLCQTEIDGCEANPCQNDGVCTNEGAGQYSCECDFGFVGEDCETEIDACEESPCANGTCDSTGPGTYFCDCDEWYEGTQCDEEILACDDSPCANGTCSRTGVGTYSCECDQNWGGTNCDVPVSGCEDSPCQNGATCVDGSGPGEFTCDCPDGYEGTTCGTPVDICAKGEDDCDNGTCNATGPGTYTCECDFGYEGATCSDAIDACGTAPCQNSGQCQSTGPGTYLCDCPTGFEGDNCEVEIDGCDDEPCLNGACTNEGAGQYTCDCDFGFEGATCADEIDACLEAPCQNGGACGPTGPGTYTCSCPAGFEGDNCEIEINGCDDAPCENGGDCINEGAGDYTCDCPAGFEGVNCEEEVSVAGTCVLSYVLSGTMDILDTEQSAGNKNISGLNGRLIIELPTLNGELNPDDGAQLRYYEMHQDFIVDAAVLGQGATVTTDVWGFAPENWSEETDLLTKIEGHEPIAIGDATGSKNAGMTLTFSDCVRPQGWDASKKTYTPNEWETGGVGYAPIDVQGTQCLQDHRSVGNVHCTKKGFLGSCGAGDLSEGNNPQDSTWNQPVPPIILAANFTSMQFDPNWGPDRDGSYTAKNGYMQIPNTTPSRTYMRWAGTLDAANSTCQNF